eukprot:6662658-Pyramimonas_sp.AAC.1
MLGVRTPDLEEEKVARGSRDRGQCKRGPVRALGLARPRMARAALTQAWVQGQAGPCSLASLG